MIMMATARLASTRLLDGIGAARLLAAARLLLAALNVRRRVAGAQRRRRRVGLRGVGECRWCADGGGVVSVRGMVRRGGQRSGGCVLGIVEVGV